MAEHEGSELGAKQDAAIIALLNEPTIQRAAQQAQISERTLYRWMEEPVFSRTYRAARRQAFSHAVTLTQRYASAAVQTLVKVMTDAKANASAKVNAASALLRFGRDALELDDIAARVEQLEQAESARKLSPGFNGMGHMMN
jgi:hypothetical protein